MESKPKRKLILVGFLIIIILFLLSGCANLTPQGNAAGGALIGGVVGNQFGSGSGRALMTGIGAMIGGTIGAGFGRRDVSSFNEGELAAYLKGQADRQRELQRQRELDAYSRGRAGY